MGDGLVADVAVDALGDALVPVGDKCGTWLALVEGAAVPWSEGQVAPWAEVGLLVVDFAEMLRGYGE